MVTTFFFDTSQLNAPSCYKPLTFNCTFKPGSIIFRVSCRKIIEQHLKSVLLTFSEDDWDSILSKAEGFSGENSQQSVVTSVLLFFFLPRILVSVFFSCLVRK